MTDTAPDTGTDATTTTDTTTTAGTDTAPPDLAAEVEKWKAQARKHEDRAKANAKAQQELEQLRQASMSDTEKAVEVARQQARAEVLAELGGQLVETEVRAAVTGRGVDADALLEGLDPTRFLGDDGKPDRAAIVAWVDRIAPKPANGFVPDLGQGTRGGPTNGEDPLLATVKRISGIR